MVSTGIWIWAFFAVILTFLVLYSWRVWYLRSVWARECQYQKEWQKTTSQDEATMRELRPYPRHHAWMLKKYTYDHRSRSGSDFDVYKSGAE